MRTRMLQNLRRMFVMVLAMAGLSVGTLVATSAPAAASATWCRYTSSVTVFGHQVPTGNYCFTVNGSGTWVNFTLGSWNGPFLINPSERVTFYDRYGNTKASWITYSGSGTTWGYRAWRSGIRGNAWAGGSACGELMSAGVPIGKICHRIA